MTVLADPAGSADPAGPFTRARRAVTARPRLFLGLAAGLAAWAAIAGRVPAVLGSVIAWDIGVAVYVGLAAILFLTEPTAHLPVHAARDQEGEWTIFAVTIAAALFSLVAVLGVFAATGHHPGPARDFRIALVAVTLFLSWLMMHTTFAFRYAHEYYTAELAPPDFDAGLEFPGESAPDYMDFYYFSLVLGMTFQVSDVQITSRKLRRLATLHGVLGFLFNTVILALTVNIAASLI